MKICLFISCLIACSLTFAQPRISIIPAPASITEKKGEFRYDARTMIYAAPEFTGQAKLLQEILGNNQQKIETVSGKKPANGIVFEKII